MATQFANGKIVTDGLVLALDAADRNSYVSGSLVWNDVSGNAAGGSLVNSPGYSASNGGSIVFDGIDDYLNTGAVIQAATSSFLQTFCSWLYGTGSNNSFFGSDANFPGQFHLILQFQSSNVLAFQGSYYGALSPTPDQNNTVSITPNSTWNHGCVVKTAASTFDVYFNGVKVITGALKGAATSSLLNLGRPWSSVWRPSVISNVQVYNRALTDQEILQNYNAQKSRFGLK
jgi:hypothetical protein